MVDMELNFLAKDARELSYKSLVAKNTKNAKWVKYALKSIKQEDIMRIEIALSVFKKFMKSIEENPFLCITNKCDNLYAEFLKIILELQNKGYNYIYQACQGVDNGYIIGECFVLTRSYTATSDEMQACDYYRLDNKFYDLINFVGIKFPYTFSLS